MNRRFVAALTGAALLTLSLTVPVGAGGGVHRVVDDDGLAGIAEDGGPVCSDGFTPVLLPGVVFSTITAAVAAAGSGDTIFICPGTYNEAVSITKTLTLSGPYAGVSDAKCKARTAQATIIGASGGPALSLAADNVIVDGLRIANTRGTGIWTSSNFSGYSIKNNRIANNWVGVDLYSTSILKTNVSGNCFTDNNNGAPGYGVRSTTDALGNAAISGNGFADQRVSAIALGGVGATHDISVNGNTSTDDKNFLTATTVKSLQVLNNTVGDTDDISVPGSAIVIGGASTKVAVSQNVINSNHTDGVLVKDTTSSTQVNGNKITSVTFGIDITTTAVAAVKAKNNRIEDVQGTLSATSVGILLGASTSGNRITHNKVLGIADMHCQDLSIGAGTLGTANTWASDIGLVSSPDGICTP
jgi:Right handed beta helix region